MLRLSIWCLLVISALCGDPQRFYSTTFRGRIIGGTEAAPGQYPSQLSLQVLYLHRCGASVLNKNWALTAAQCVEWHAVNNIQLVSGTINLSSGGTRHQAARIVMHEGYNSSNSWINDIAVIEVVEPFVMGEFVQPISLPSQDLPTETGAPATVIGWGRLSSEGIYPNELRAIDIEVADQDICILAYNNEIYDVYPTMICAKDPDNKKATCTGDQGGPLIVDGTVVGLDSWGFGCSQSEYPDVYTRVASYRDWITQNTGV